MKKLTLMCLMIIGIFLFNSYNQIEALDNAPFYVQSTATNRFTYATDQYGDNVDLDIVFRFKNDPILTEYTINIEQIDYDGNHIKFLRSVDVYPILSGSTGNYTYNLLYDFRGIFYQRNMAFYRVTYGQNVLWSGMIMNRPDYDDLNGDSIEFGPYVYNDNSLPNIEQQSQFTYASDEYFILHYRLNIAVETPGQELYVKFHNLDSFTLQENFNSDHIIYSQLYNYDTNFELTRNSFIIVSLNGVLPPFLEDVPDSMNEQLDQFVFDFQDEISYMLTLTSNTDVYFNNASAVLNIVNDGTSAFDIYTQNDSYSLNDNIRLTFFKTSESISNAFCTTQAYDESFLPIEFDPNDIDSVDRTLVYNYDVEPSVVTGDSSEVYWRLMVCSTPYASADTTYFRIEVDNVYVIVDNTQIDHSLFSILTFFNANDTSGYLLVVLLTFTIINLIMLLKVTQNIAFVSLINAFVLILFIFLGLVEIWFSVIFGLILIIAFILGVRGGGYHE